ncbi:MAG: HDOD domain-containing protein [Pseudomonadales bacterium]|nr:HDOD domain-containing protein [Pseudomonadales bacterium]
MSDSHLVIVPGADRQFREALRKRQLHLPVLPRVAAMVIQLTSDDNADATQLARLIQGDPALASNVMKMANSPAYRPSVPFVSLQQAIARLGMTTVSEIALATSLNADLFDVRGHEYELTRYWQASLRRSAWARELARMRKTNVEASFIAGLLSYIGQPVVLQGVSVLQLMTGNLPGFVDKWYVEAGLALATTWELPAVVIESISQHQMEVPTGPFREEILNVIAASVLVGADNDPGALPENLLAELNFYADDLEKIASLGTSVDEWAGAIAG